jgi:isopentenyldiphosphate isomerase/intracellular septation protein A
MTKLDILKSLAPGFLPLIIFIAADAFFEPALAIAIAVGAAIIELAISYIKDKILDKFILFDVGLIILLGMVSILLDNEIFFKLKPAVIELLFCIILGVSVFSPVNIMMMMTKRYMKNIQLGKAQLEQLNRSLKVLFFIFLGHTVLIVYSAFFMSRQAWAFISGGLFYMLFGFYFVVELVRKKIKQKKWFDQYRDDEWFDIVDEDGRVKGRAPRGVCHSAPGMMHPVVHLHVIDSKDRVFLQKRAMTKEILPGKWDTAVGGHLSSGESVEDGLKREAAEELGITEFNAQLVAKYVWESDIETELVFMFICRYERAITLNKEEIDDGKFWKIKKIKENLGKGIITPNFEFEFDLLSKLLSGGIGRTLDEKKAANGNPRPKALHNARTTK